MALLGDIRESTIKEKEMIDSDLQKMGESLQLLKASVEKDATILAKADFSDLLQHIVTDLSALSQTSDILLLQQTLQSQENLTAADLDKIIQQFISVKLEYTANKSLHLTDTSLQKYKQLIEHKSAMDDLLLKISQTPSETVDAQVDETTTSEIVTDTSETTTLVTEELDPEVVKAQQALIDGQKVASVDDASKKDDKKEEEKKSFWDRAKDSSFGLAYIFGADRMSSAKEWISESWNTFKEWIGWKKKEKKDDKKEESSSSPEAAVVSTEATPSSIDINNGLTDQERLLRNTYIKQSILDTTAVPISIDYKTDKNLLLDKGSPDAISFDTVSQSIVLGDAKVKLSFPEFPMKVGGINATVKKVDIRSIQVSGDEFVVEAKGTGSAGFLEQTKDISTTLSKEKFYALLQPYLESGKSQYDTSLEFDGQTVPLKLDVAGSIEPNPSLTETDSQAFMGYKNQIYNTYPDQEKKYLDALSKHSSDMYKSAATGLDKERMPALLQDYDADLLTGLDGGILAIIGKQYSSVSELTKDTILGRAGNLANDVLGTIVSFLETREDNDIVGWLASILKWAPDKLKDLIPNGNEQKQNALRKTIEKQMKDDPAIKKDLEKVVKQFSLVRFYFTEKQAVLQDKGINASVFDSLSLPAAADFLQKQSLLDASISAKTTVGLEANRVSVALQQIIKDTDKEDDFSKERGEIKFNYETNKLESWGKETKIDIYEGNKFGIEGLEGVYFDLRSVLWLANLSNRLRKQSPSSSSELSYSDAFIRGGLVINKDFSIWGSIFNPYKGLKNSIDPVLVKKDSFEKNVTGWSAKTGEKYAEYMRNKLSFLGKLLG